MNIDNFVKKKFWKQNNSLTAQKLEMKKTCDENDRNKPLNCTSRKEKINMLLKKEMSMNQKLSKMMVPD